MDRFADPGYNKPDTRARVYFGENPHYYLSNRSAFTVRYNELIFPTAENALQFQRHSIDQDDQRHLDWLTMCATKLSPLALRITLESHQVQEYASWIAVRENIMYDLLWCKMTQHPELVQMLKKTKRRELICDELDDPYWGWGKDAKGANALGRLWMRIREQIEQGTR